MTWIWRIEDAWSKEWRDAEYEEEAIEKREKIFWLSYSDQINLKCFSE